MGTSKRTYYRSRKTSHIKLKMTKQQILKKVQTTPVEEICQILAEKEYNFSTIDDIILRLQEKYELLPIELLRDLYLGNLCLGSEQFVTWEEADWYE